MFKSRPYVLSIAGFDPSAGAGVLADIKTFESCKSYGFGICSALTFQNDEEFKGLQWIPVNDIMGQLELLAKKYSIQAIKIGIIENLTVLDTIINSLHSYSRGIPIIWDPVLGASAGYQFHNFFDEKILHTILQKITLVTPNLEEASLLFPPGCNHVNLLQEYQQEKNICNILLKGGHAKGGEKKDILIEPGKITTFSGRAYKGYEKHGTGCVLSSAITSHLAGGNSLPVACKKAKKYIHSFIKSNKTKLGYHP